MSHPDTPDGPIDPGESDGTHADTDSEVSEPTLAAGRRRLRIVAAILVVQAVGLAMFAGYLVVNLVGGSKQTTATSNTVIEIVAFVVVCVVLVLLARGCLRAQRWARAPVLVVELITLLGIGWPMLQGSMWYRLPLGLPVTLGSLAAIVLLLTPSTTAVLESSRD